MEKSEKLTSEKKDVREEEYFEEEEEYLVEDEYEEQNKIGRQNYVAGKPSDEDLIYEDKKVSKKRYKLAHFIIPGILILAVFFVAAVFIVSSRNDKEGQAVVKDNSIDLGINADVNNSVPDYEKVYKDLYENQNSNANVNAGNSVLPDTNSDRYERVSNDIVAPPDAVINPNASDSLSSADLSTRSGGATTVSNNPPITRAPETVENLEPDKSTIIVDNTSLLSDVKKNKSFRREQTLYFYQPPKTNNDSGSIREIAVKTGYAAKPEFGAILPVRILGSLHTLGTKGFARMELTRTIQVRTGGEIPRGTLFVGRVQGSEGKRLFVSLLGYIEGRTNRLVKIGGDLQGNDGALGVKGDVRRIGSRWKKIFGEALQTAKDVGTAYLLGRRGGNGTFINTGDTSAVSDQIIKDERTKYVVVPANSNAYIVITDLPPAFDVDQRLAGRTISDDEILKMIETDSSAELEALVPSLSEEGRQIARKAVEN